MKDKKVEALGSISGVLTTVSLIPQVISIWIARPTPATAISLPMYIIFNIGIAGWLIYGIRIKSKPLTMANAITLALGLSVLAYKLIYG